MQDVFAGMLAANPTGQSRMTGNTKRRLRRMALVSVCALLGACASTSTASVTGTTGAGASDVTKEARLLQMTDRRLLDTALVDEMLADGNNARRARAALAVGQVKGKARYQRLRQLLVDADTAVAANAAFALGLGRDSASVVALARAVAGAPDPVAIAAARALGDLGDVSRSVLTLALGDGTAQPLTASTAAQRSAPVRAALVTATTKLRNPPVALLLPWLGDSDPQVVRAAAYVLARTRAPGGVRAMIALRTTSDEETRQHVARILTRATSGDSLSPRALEALGALMSDTSARVRVNAVRSLATFGTQTRDQVLRALRDPDGNVRVATSEILSPLLGTDANAWRAAWEIDSTLPVRINLLVSARRLGLAALQAAEAEWKMSGDWRKRVAALNAMRADTARPTRLVDVAWAVNDRDMRVRDAGVMALRDVVADEPPMADSVRKIWRTKFQDSDMIVRANAIRSLNSTANADGSAAVLDVYDRAKSDPDNDVRNAAIDYVSRAWGRDSARFTPALRSRLTALPIPADSAERAVARNVTPLSAWRSTTTVASAKPLSEYENLVRRYLLNTKQPTAVIHTEKGDITLALFGQIAPITVNNFVELSRSGYYRNSAFHRVVPNFVAQDGDPRETGSGSGPGYSIRDELTRVTHVRGCLAMALSGPDTGGSQYYLCHSPQPHLDGGYTVFGHILQGYDVLDRIVQTDRILSIEIR